MSNPIEQVKPMFENETYGFVNTSQVLEVFKQHGWNVVSQSVARVRKVEKQGFQKHLIKLENPLYTINGLTENNRSRPQLVLINSHDGTSSLKILWGLFRVACLNGIISGTGIQGVRLVHSKSIVDKLPDAISYMLDNFKVFTAQIEALQNRQLSEIAVNSIVKSVYDARLKGVHGVKSVRYELPRVRRLQDTGNDAYTVFNRIQEVLVRGGIEYWYETKNNDLVFTRTRAVKSVSTQVKLNQLVYDETIREAA